MGNYPSLSGISRQFTANLSMCICSYIGMYISAIINL